MKKTVQITINIEAINNAMDSHVKSEVINIASLHAAEALIKAAQALDMSKLNVTQQIDFIIE